MIQTPFRHRERASTLSPFQCQPCHSPVGVGRYRKSRPDLPQARKRHFCARTQHAHPSVPRHFDEIAACCGAPALRRDAARCANGYELAALGHPFGQYAAGSVAGGKGGQPGRCHRRTGRRHPGRSRNYCATVTCPITCSSRNPNCPGPRVSLGPAQGGAQSDRGPSAPRPPPVRADDRL